MLTSWPEQLVTTGRHRFKPAISAYQSLITGTSPNLVENELGVVANRSITANQQLSAALPPATTFPITTNSNLASQLNVVAGIISARAAPGVGTSRQVFLVSIGGFDNHDVLLTQHNQQLTQVNSAVNDFYSWLVQMNVHNDVTLFTASDFGRTLTSNGDGSDHGWGSHHFVLGGAVQGGNVYGTLHPTVFGSGNPVDIGQGNMVQELAVNQYAATFARWLGVSDTYMPLGLPKYRLLHSALTIFHPVVPLKEDRILHALIRHRFGSQQDRAEERRRSGQQEELESLRLQGHGCGYRAERARAGSRL